MKHPFLLALLTLALLAIAPLALGAFASQDVPQPTGKLEQHEWLSQLVGEWKVVGEATAEPGQDPISWKSTESIRQIGDLWIVAESKANYNGEPFTSLLTLGYDPAKKTFVGSWIDTILPTMWTYVGQLDKAKRTLTLKAEGPSATDPKKMTTYRDQIQLLGPNDKKITSSILMDDGTWTTYMTSKARRVN